MPLRQALNPLADLRGMALGTNECPTVVIQVRRDTGDQLNSLPAQRQRKCCKGLECLPCSRFELLSWDAAGIELRHHPHVFCGAVPQSG